MTTSNHKDDRQIVSRSLLKHSNVKVGRERDTYVFVIPADTAERIKQEYSFSFDQLKVGGEISLPELAVHIDEQAASEARWGTVCEIARHKLEVEKLVFEEWYENLLYKCRVHLENIRKGTVTEGTIKGYAYHKHGAEIAQRRQKQLDLELQYRMLNNVIRAALAVKGQLLPTLRNIVQGKGEAAAIDVKVAQKVRVKLITKR
jgi:hypothetical protein